MSKVSAIEELEEFAVLVFGTLDTLKGRQCEIDIAVDLSNLSYELITSISHTIDKIETGARGHQ